VGGRVQARECRGGCNFGASRGCSSTYRVLLFHQLVIRTFLMLRKTSQFTKCSAFVISFNSHTQPVTQRAIMIGLFIQRETVSEKRQITRLSSTFRIKRERRKQRRDRGKRKDGMDELGTVEPRQNESLNIQMPCEFLFIYSSSSLRK
jgi:hypothetical protein